MVSRREFLRYAGIGTAGAILAACAPKIQEVLVKETVETERVVEKEVPVVQTVETERLVEREVVRIAGQPYWSPPDLSGRELSIWGLNYDPHIEAYHRLAKLFSTYTGCTYIVEPVEWPIEDNIVTGMAAGMVPDVVCIMGQRIGPLTVQNALIALDDVYAQTGCDVDTWFGPVAIQAYQYGGNTWGVPTEGNNVSGISNARFDKLEEAGASDLWPSLDGRDGFKDFDEMWALAAAMQEAGVVANGLSSEGWYTPQLLGVMRTLGQYWWEPNTRTFHLDSEAGLEAMYLLNFHTIYNLEIESHLGESSTESMMAGKVGICNGNVAMPGTGQTLEPPIDIDSVAFPSAISGREALYVGEGGWGFCVPSQAANVDVGVEFMKFLMTYEGQKTYSYIYGGLMSSCLAVNSDPDLFAPGIVGDAMKRASKVQERTVYYGTGYGAAGEMVGIINTVCEAVRISDMTPEEAVVEAQVGLEEMLARFDAGV